MKRYIIVEDLIKKVRQKSRDRGDDLTLSYALLLLTNWLEANACPPIQLRIHSRETPDPELDAAIAELQAVCEAGEGQEIGSRQAQACHTALRYLLQLRLLKGEYARVFFEDGPS